MLSTLLLDPSRKTALFVLNDGIADGRDISWIWDADFEVAAGKLGPGVHQRHARRRDGAAPQVRRVAGADDGGRPGHRARARPRHRATPEGACLTVVPTYTAMLTVRELLAKRTGKQAFWRHDERNDQRTQPQAGPPLPGADEHLRRPRQHHLPAAPLPAAWHRPRGGARSRSATRWRRRASTCCSWAGRRTTSSGWSPTTCTRTKGGAARRGAGRRRVPRRLRRLPAVGTLLSRRSTVTELPGAGVFDLYTVHPGRRRSG